MALMLLLNNFFHDFAVAILFACLMLLSFQLRALSKYGVDYRSLFRDMYASINRLVIGAWVFIVVGGAVRTWAYKDYEWVEAAGKGQIAALVIKHILLVSLVVWGSWLQIKVRRTIKNWD